MNHDEPVLTRTQVCKWQARLAELTGSIRTMQEEISDLTRKLDAAKVIMGELPAPNEAQQMTMSGIVPPKPLYEVSIEPASVTGSVIAAIETLGSWAEPPAIRQWIKENRPHAAEKLQVTPQYLYSVLMRLHRSKRLIKDGKGRYRIRTSSPAGDAGGVAPPA